MLLLAFLVLLTMFEELVVFRRPDVVDLEVDIGFMVELVFVLVAVLIDDKVAFRLEDEDKDDFLLEEVIFLLDDEEGFLLLDDLVELVITAVFVTEVFLVEDPLVLEEIDFSKTQSQSVKRLFALYFRNGDVVLGLVVWSVLSRRSQVLLTYYAV